MPRKHKLRVRARNQEPDYVLDGVYNDKIFINEVYANRNEYDLNGYQHVLHPGEKLVATTRFNYVSRNNGGKCKTVISTLDKDKAGHDNPEDAVKLKDHPIYPPEEAANEQERPGFDFRLHDKIQNIKKKLALVESKCRRLEDKTTPVEVVGIRYNDVNSNFTEFKRPVHFRDAYCGGRRH